MVNPMLFDPYLDVNETIVVRTPGARPCNENNLTCVEIANLEQSLCNKLTEHKIETATGE